MLAYRGLVKMIHETANVDKSAMIGKHTKIWDWCRVRENTNIGMYTILGKGVYVDNDFKIGNNVKIQNNVSVYRGVIIKDCVFVGPHVCFTNDKVPRAVTLDEKLKDEGFWSVTPIIVDKGASIGANATILPGVIIGEWSMVGAGSVVTKDVPPYTLVVGNPARVVCSVDKEGNKI